MSIYGDVGGKDDAGRVFRAQTDDGTAYRSQESGSVAVRDGFSDL